MKHLYTEQSIQQYISVFHYNIVLNILIYSNSHLNTRFAFFTQNNIVRTTRDNCNNTRAKINDADIMFYQILIVVVVSKYLSLTRFAYNNVHHYTVQFLYFVRLLRKQIRSHRNRICYIYQFIVFTTGAHAEIRLAACFSTSVPRDECITDVRIAFSLRRTDKRRDKKSLSTGVRR